jgi:hypothetical protein
MQRNVRSSLLFLGTLAMGTGSFAVELDERAVTFSEHVAPILQEHCQSCHRPGDIAPMSLLTYEEARPWAKAIRRVVADRTMPPWHADAPPAVFANDVSLSVDEIATVLAWVDGGARRGKSRELPPPRSFAVDGWKAGAPDLVYWMAESYTMPAAVEDEYRCFVIPDAIEEDFWFSGMEIQPGNRAIVHHLIVAVDTEGTSRDRDAADARPGFGCDMASGGIGTRILGDWEPGARSMPPADGIATRIEAGTTLVLQIHYHNTTAADQTDRSGLGLYLARTTVRQQPQRVAIADYEFEIPAGDANAETIAQWEAPDDLHLRSIMPHMHYLGKDMAVTAHFVDGTQRVLLNVPRYDFDWQTSYLFREPVPIPKGTVLRMVAHHDNSAENPDNPFDPPRDVAHGEATTDEMAVAWTLYTLDREQLALEPVIPEAMIAANQRKERARLAGSTAGSSR